MLMNLSEQRQSALARLPVGARQPGLSLRQPRAGALEVTEFKERIMWLSYVIERLILADFNTLHPHLRLDDLCFMLINHPVDLKWLSA